MVKGSETGNDGEIIEIPARSVPPWAKLCEKTNWFVIRNTRFRLDQVESADTRVKASYDLEKHEPIQHYDIEIGLVSGRTLTFRFAQGVKLCKQVRDKLDRALDIWEKG